MATLQFRRTRHIDDIKRLWAMARRHDVLRANVYGCRDGGHVLRVASPGRFDGAVCTVIDYVATQRDLLRVLGY